MILVDLYYASLRRPFYSIGQNQRAILITASEVSLLTLTSQNFRHPNINIANIRFAVLQRKEGSGLILIKGTMMNESTSNPDDSEMNDASSPYQPPTVESTATQPASTGQPLASAGRRFGAFLLDGVVIGIGGMILGMLLGGTILGMIGMGAGVDAGAAPEEAAAAAALGGFIGGLLGTIIGPYIAIFIMMILECFTGITPGKLMLGMKVSNADGSDANLGSIVIRGLLKYQYNWVVIVGIFTGLDFLVTISGILSLVMFFGIFLIFGEGRQTLWDKMAKTSVVMKD